MNPAPSPPPGRPRDPQKDLDVIAATRDLLAEVGFQGTTVVAIARRAGVGAPTIYRRWPRREELIEDAAFGHDVPGPVPPATGELRTDLRVWTRLFLDYLATPVARSAIPGLLMAYQHDENLYGRLATRLHPDVVSELADVLRPWVSDPRHLQARTAAVFDLLVSATAIRAMTVGLTDRDTYCDATADALCVLTCSDWRLPERVTEPSRRAR